MSKKLPVEELQPDFLLGMAEVVQNGNEKYEPGDWKKNRTPKSLLASVFRHLLSLLKGEHVDSESGLPHSHHIAINMMYFQYLIDNKRE